jgi:formamidopyrimidine-DNA glycosylase
MLAVNPVLTGALRLCQPSERLVKKTSFILSLSDGQELRHLDETQIGAAFYIDTAKLDQVPRLEGQGPDALDQHPSFSEFKENLRHFQGEIRGVLTLCKFLAGLGNACPDEVLFEDGIFPFKRRKAL